MPDLADSIYWLASLNPLSAEDHLDVVITSLGVTDRSLTTLLEINSFESLDVTETGISDEGITQLKRRFPTCYVLERKEVESGVSSVDPTVEL